MTLSSAEWNRIYQKALEQQIAQQLGKQLPQQKAA
jgi:Rod binding domain-containing protein